MAAKKKAPASIIIPVRAKREDRDAWAKAAAVDGKTLSDVAREAWERQRRRMEREGRR